MWTFLRHLFAIAALPCMVAIVIPIWIARDGGVDLTIGATAPQIIAQVLGGCVAVIGFTLAAASMRRFAGEGRGARGEARSRPGTRPACSSCADPTATSAIR